MRIKLLTLLAALVLGLAACGGDDEEGQSEEEKVTEVAEEFAKAAEKDGEKACSYLSEETAAQYEREEDCFSAFGPGEPGTSVASAEPKVEDVKVDGDKATLKLQGEEFEFVKEDGNWKVTF